MNAQPKRWQTWESPTRGGKPKIIPAENGLWVECEVTHPPSSEGRSVDVFFPADLVTEMLLEFRDEARRMRAVPNGETP